MKNLVVLLFVTSFLQGQAQYHITFKLTSLPSYPAAGYTIFVAGSFNNWKPDSTGFGTTSRSLSVLLPKGSYEYKFTRGSWHSSETDANGSAVDNRTIYLESDTIITVEIKEWADHFPQQQRKSTAGKHVHIIDTAFYMPQLNRYRRIWIYLPESYSTSYKRYPVMYMQDGQNVFDDATSFSGEWGIDETLDTLGPQTHECIIVAIDHGGAKRINEYAPYNMEKYGVGEGDHYADFLVHTLKPYIKKHYRIKSGRKHQFVAGSSMGGLLSFYTLLKYPKAFGSAGVFSPSFWIAPQLKDAITAKAKKVKGGIYFYAGKDESESMLPDLMTVFGQMRKTSKAKMTVVIRTDGQHNEARWRQEFPLFYKWLMQ